MQIYLSFGKRDKDRVVSLPRTTAGRPQKTVRVAARCTGLTKRNTSHPFRHNCATHLLENEVKIRIAR